MTEQELRRLDQFTNHRLGHRRWRAFAFLELRFGEASNHKPLLGLVVDRGGTGLCLTDISSAVWLLESRKYARKGLITSLECPPLIDAMMRTWR